MIIVGAGLSGLIAAHAFPQAHIYERGGNQSNHKALLRFRTDAVSRITNIPFRKVRVRKGIWQAGEFIKPNILAANNYSFKTLGKYQDRSIWNIDECDRFIAPADFYDQMIGHVEHRLHLDTDIDFVSIPDHNVFTEAVISTVPLHVHASRLGVTEQFQRSKIYVNRFRVPNADVHQTIYFPALAFPIYRASMTGDLFIVESISQISDLQFEFNKMLSAAFGIQFDSAEYLGETEQNFGKIAPIDEVIRRQMITRLTREFGIYSLGRFAIWRNILLDDLVHDIDVIKQLISTDSYGKSIITGQK